MEPKSFDKSQRQAAKDFLKLHQANEIYTLNMYALKLSRHKLDNGELWDEKESLLDEPEYTYILKKSMEEETMKAKNKAGTPPLQHEAIADVQQIRGLVRDLNTVNESLVILHKAYEKLALNHHILKVGGIAGHSGSFANCRHKDCLEHRAVLAAVKLPIDKHTTQ